jgi:hypothetical protein
MVAGVTSFPSRRMDDFPGERDKPRADRRQSRDRDASKGGEACNTKGFINKGKCNSGGGTH